MYKINLIEKHKVLKGEQRFYEHFSDTLNSIMRFSVFLPQEALYNDNCPVLYFLPGVNSNEYTFPEKGSFQRFANRYDIIVVSPDTSPRGDNIPNSESVYLGHGAGFYINATKEPWSKNFNMYDYITNELVSIVSENFTKVA